MAGRADSIRSIFFALGANLAIAVAKLGAAVATGSSAMLAEAIHSFADSGNQGLLLLGLARAKRPPSPDYPLGHGKAIYFWSFIVALVLFMLGGLFSIYEGAHKLGAPEPLTYPWVAVGILVFGVIAECVSLYGCLTEVNKVREGRSLWQWFRESRQSELVVVLGEDIAALLGLALALVAVLATMASGDPRYDALGSIAIGVVLVVVAIGIAVEIKGLLIGQSADPNVEKALREFLAQREEVAEVYRLLTLQLGASLMVSVKARMRERGSVDAMVASINRVEAALRAAFPDIQWLFFEPDVKD
ncbi:MAG: cation diffusion facilitator family transporter [Betaproteobacteria bacterium]|nr:cation diffusion facilitator family transporter [Betaproteobacteria bacterium]